MSLSAMQHLGPKVYFKHTISVLFKRLVISQLSIFKDLLLALREHKICVCFRDLTLCIGLFLKWVLEIHG